MKNLLLTIGVLTAIGASANTTEQQLVVVKANVIKGQNPTDTGVSVQNSSLVAHSKGLAQEDVLYFIQSGFHAMPARDTNLILTSCEEAIVAFIAERGNVLPNRNPREDSYTISQIVSFTCVNKQKEQQ